MNDRVFLTIEDRRKSVPYPPESHQESQNFGFQPLKGKIDKVERIQEAQGFPGIISALKAINAKRSPFFSIGCEKYIGPEKFGGYYARGYIEFALNYAHLVSFVQTADLFRMFSNFCSHREIPAGATYNFDLQPNHFVKANVEGYSCCVWTRTGSHLSHADAERAYNDAVKFLGDFIVDVALPTVEQESIY